MCSTLHYSSAKRVHGGRSARYTLQNVRQNYPPNPYIFLITAVIGADRRPSAN